MFSKYSLKSSISRTGAGILVHIPFKNIYWVELLIVRSVSSFGKHDLKISTIYLKNNNVSLNIITFYNDLIFLKRTNNSKWTSIKSSNDEPCS